MERSPIDGADQACSTHSLQTTYCPQHCIMLPTETFHMGKCLLTCSLIKPRENTEAVLKTYDVFIFGDILYISNVLCKTVPNIDTLTAFVNCFF